MLAVDINNEQESDELLQAVKALWVRTRGRSYAAELVEQYKEALSKQTKGARGTRKTLKSK